VKRSGFLRLLLLAPLGARQASAASFSPDRAIHFLLRHQSDDGAWRSETYGAFRDGRALTPHVLRCLARFDDPALASAKKKAVSWLLARASDDLFDDFPVHIASALLESAARIDTLAPLQPVAVKRLLSLQTESGGWSYSPVPVAPSDSPAPMQQPNLSATAIAIDGLRAAGGQINETAGKVAEGRDRPPGGPREWEVNDRPWADYRAYHGRIHSPPIPRTGAETDPCHFPTASDAIVRSLPFVRSCQNHGTGDPAFDDGGFFQMPLDPTRNKAGQAGIDRHGNPRFTSYAAATADGLRCLLSAAPCPGISARACPGIVQRSRAARQWLDSFSWSPDAPPADLAYYAARGISLTASMPGGSARAVRSMRAGLEKAALPDGSWKNPAAEMRENDPIVATALALEASLG